jgi:hypothetical protein
MPSLFFIILFTSYALGSSILTVKLIAGFVALLLLGNMFLRNNITVQVFGYIFLIGSIYMMLAWLDDVLDGEATLSYLVGLFLIFFSLTMSVLLIRGFEKKNKISEAEQC